MTTTPNSTTPLRFTVRTLTATFVALAVIAGAIIWRFSPWTHQYFYGDDLDYLFALQVGSCATKASEILTATCQERFRPVASAFVIATMDWFGGQMKFYNVTNFTIQFISAALAFACGMRLSRGRILVAAILALAIGTSRFALFHATQAIGPVESLTFAAALGCIYCVLRFDADSSKSSAWAIGALLSAFIAIYTHERFVVLAAWLMIAFLSSPTARNIPRRMIYALALACIALPASYIGYKTLVLDTTFMVGTNGTHLGFDIERIVGFARDAVLSIFGFNQGPDYLVGSQSEVGYNPATLFGAVFAASWLALFSVGILCALQARRGAGLVASIDAVRWPLLLLILASFTLFPALLTIRLEQRWLFMPFALIVLIPAWAVGHVSSGKRNLAIGLACIFGLSSVAVDSIAMRHFDRIFLINSAHFAQLAKRDIVDLDSTSSEPIRIVADASHCEWTLRRGMFFGIYGKGIRLTTCYASVAEATKGGMPPGEELFVYNADDKLVNMTQAVNSSLADGSTNGQPIAFDFISNFAAGKISDTRHVDTPTGRGALVLPWESTLGRRDAMIVLSGFSQRFENIEVPADSSLNFGVSMMYPAPQSARLVVTATPMGSPARTLLSLDLVPPGAGATLDFQLKTIDLANLGGQKVTFDFSVQSPGGNSTSHWIGLVQPVIVQRVATSLPRP